MVHNEVRDGQRRVDGVDMRAQGQRMFHQDPTETLQKGLINIATTFNEISSRADSVSHEIQLPAALLRPWLTAASHVFCE